MNKPSTPNIHCDGWWDHMPPGHDLDIIMNGAELPSSRDGTVSRRIRRTALWLCAQPTGVVMAEPGLQARSIVSAPSRRIKRSHANAWIVVAAVCATGGALAMAAVSDPQSLREHFHSAMAEVKNLTGSSSTPPTALTTAQAATPAPTSVYETASVTASQATVPAQSLSSDAGLPPLPPIAPAAGHSVIHPVPVTDVKPVAMRVPGTIKELVADTPPVMPSLAPPTELEPVQPLAAAMKPSPSPSPSPSPLVLAQPAVQSPPVVAPLIVQPPVEVAPPPLQPPASSPQ